MLPKAACYLVNTYRQDKTTIKWPFFKRLTLSPALQRWNHFHPRCWRGWIHLERLSWTGRKGAWMCKPARSLDSGNCSLTWTSRGLQWWSACQSERWARSSRYHRSCTGRCRACHWTWGSAGDRWNWRGSWRRNGARLSRPSRCCETLTGCDRHHLTYKPQQVGKENKKKDAAILHPQTILHCCTGIKMLPYTKTLS